MGRMRAVVGFDIGTSSLKAAVFSAKTCRMTASATWNYPVRTGREIGIMPVSVYENMLQKALVELSHNYELISAALTTQMYSVLKKSSEGVLVYQWNCPWQRNPSVEEVARAFLLRSGCRVDTLYPGYKLASLAEEERKEFLPYGLKEDLLQFLTGNLCTDYSTASAFGVFDAVKRKWNMDAVRGLRLDESLLPRAVAHDKAVGNVRQDILPGETVTVTPGLGDGPAASLACTAVSSFCGNLGTSMAARVITEKPDFSEKNGLWNYAVDDRRYTIGGISSNSCTVTDWAKSFGTAPENELPDNDEVEFFPWLLGERMPYWSSDLRGTLIGLRLRDSPDTVCGAVARGVAYTFCRMALALEPHTDPKQPLVIAGGGTNMRALLKVISGVLNRSLVILENETYLGSIGAAISAGAAVGLKMNPDLKIREWISPTHAFATSYFRWNETAEQLADFYRRRMA